MDWFSLTLEIVGVIVVITALMIILSYFADKEYWTRRVREGGHSRTDFERDVQHFEDKEKPVI